MTSFDCFILTLLLYSLPQKHVTKLHIPPPDIRYWVLSWRLKGCVWDVPHKQYERWTNKGTNVSLSITNGNTFKVRMSMGTEGWSHAPQKVRLRSDPNLHLFPIFNFYYPSGCINHTIPTSTPTPALSHKFCIILLILTCWGETASHMESSVLLWILPP